MSRQLMYRLLVASTLCVCTMTACQKPTALPSGPFIEATPAAPPEPEVRVVGVPYAQPVPGQARPMPPASPTEEEIAEATAQKLSPAEVMAAANEKARQAPTPEGFVNATLVYDFMPGALYQVWAAPLHLTTLTFAPGEEIISFGQGENLRWTIGKTWSGEGASKRWHLLLKPTVKGLHMSLVVTTNLGVYNIELKSYQHDYLAEVTFQHPGHMIEMMQQEAATLNRAREERANSSKETGELAVDLQDIEDRYRLIVEDEDDVPPWTPRRVFHDGRKTFIDFGKTMGGEELPSLFLYSKSKKPRVVQYTMKGRYMVVAGVVELAVLRLGEEGEEDESVGIELKKEARR